MGLVLYITLQGAQPQTGAEPIASAPQFIRLTNHLHFEDSVPGTVSTRLARVKLHAVQTAVYSSNANREPRRPSRAEQGPTE